MLRKPAGVGYAVGWRRCRPVTPPWMTDFAEYQHSSDSRCYPSPDASGIDSAGIRRHNARGARLADNCRKSTLRSGVPCQNGSAFDRSGSERVSIVLGVRQGISVCNGFPRVCVLSSADPSRPCFFARLYRAALAAYSLPRYLRPRFGISK